MPSVFISYAAQDKALARRLTDDLKTEGIKVWLDVEQIMAGESITERVDEGLRSSDYLIVLLSEHSRKSAWVIREIATAFREYADKANTAILPVRIDDSPPPENLAGLRYVDLAKDYQRALNELLDRLKKGTARRTDLRDVLDTEELASDIAADRVRTHGPEFYVTTSLTVLAIIVSLITAWPSFKTVFGRVPKVYYDVKSETVTLPPGANEAQVIQLLENQGIAPSGLRIRVINKGQAKATEVKIGAEVKGKFLYVNSTPREASRPVWVDISLDGFNPGAKESRFSLKNLVPGKPVVFDLGFGPKDASFSCDVVSDGVFATRVQDIEAIPSWSILRAFQTPIIVLIVGLVVSLLIGIGIAAKRNPRTLDKLVSLIETVLPAYGRLIRLLLE